MKMRFFKMQISRKYHITIFLEKRKKGYFDSHLYPTPGVLNYFESCYEYLHKADHA